MKTQTCKTCGNIKPLTRKYFRTERFLEDGSCTFRKACAECESNNSKVVQKLKLENPLPPNYECPICLRKEKEIKHRKPWCCDHDHDHDHEHEPEHEHDSDAGATIATGMHWGGHHC